MLGSGYLKGSFEVGTLCKTVHLSGFWWKLIAFYRALLCSWADLLYSHHIHTLVLWHYTPTHHHIHKLVLWHTHHIHTLVLWHTHPHTTYTHLCFDIHTHTPNTHICALTYTPTHQIHTFVLWHTHPHHIHKYIHTHLLTCLLMYSVSLMYILQWFPQFIKNMCCCLLRKRGGGCWSLFSLIVVLSARQKLNIIL